MLNSKLSLQNNIWKTYAKSDCPKIVIPPLLENVDQFVKLNTVTTEELIENRKSEVKHGRHWGFFNREFKYLGWSF